MRRWLAAAARPDVVRRSIKVCLLVGTLLVLINYSDRAVNGELTALDLVKMLLTYAVPYCVSTFVSVSTLIDEGK
ncbi:MAG: nitrate/nitrite transporter NrtS, partial [Gammaproteobacteria bacterium]|nr:nitrate/nitrite transporter NrtS [Gammaproteobacteria bacterium]